MIKGLVEMLFDDPDQTVASTGVSVVSDGVECILLNKNFFLNHLNDSVRKSIKETVIIYDY
jgi:hypothetical protein